MILIKIRELLTCRSDCRHFCSYSSSLVSCRTWQMVGRMVMVLRRKQAEICLFIADLE